MNDLSRYSRLSNLVNRVNRFTAPIHGSHSRPCVLVNRFTAPLLGHSDVIRRVIMICFTGTDGEPIHVNEKCHAVDKMNDESDESVHLSPCVYVKDEPVH